MAIYRKTVLIGNPPRVASNVIVEVFVAGTLTHASLTDLNDNVLSNPLSVIGGEVVFKTADGEYDIKYTVGSQVEIENNVVIGLPVDVILEDQPISLLDNDLNFIDSSGAPLQSVAGRTGDVVLTKIDITDFLDSDYATFAQGALADSALQSGDNISELVNDSGYIPSSEKGAANGLATLGGDSKIISSQLPALAITNTFIATDQSAMLALSTAETGDVAVRTDVNKSFILSGTDYATLGDWQELLTPTDSVLSVNGYTGAVTLTKSDVGLSNVDNTSDLNKPISTATQTALDDKLDIVFTDQGTTIEFQNGGGGASPHLRIGQNTAGGGMTDANGKYFLTVMPHYNSDTEEDICVLVGLANNGGNLLKYGGGSTNFNGATKHQFFTSPDITTTTPDITFEVNNSNLVCSVPVELPSYATASLPTGTEGEIVYDMDSNVVKTYNGTEWQGNIITVTHNITSGASPADFNHAPTWFFVANRKYKILSASVVYGTATTDGTATITRDSGTEAIGAGDTVATFDPSATANTVYSLSLSNTDLVAGDRLSFSVTATDKFNGAAITFDLAVM